MEHQIMQLRMPPQLLAAVNRARAVEGLTLSALVRELIVLGLTARGYWPPTPEAE